MKKLGFWFWVSPVWGFAESLPRAARLTFYWNRASKRACVSRPRWSQQGPGSAVLRRLFLARSFGEKKGKVCVWGFKKEKKERHSSAQLLTFIVQVESWDALCLQVEGKRLTCLLWIRERKENSSEKFGKRKGKGKENESKKEKRGKKLTRLWHHPPSRETSSRPDAYSTVTHRRLWFFHSRPVQVCPWRLQLWVLTLPCTRLRPRPFPLRFPRLQARTRGAKSCTPTQKKRGRWLPFSKTTSSTLSSFVFPKA